MDIKAWTCLHCSQRYANTDPLNSKVSVPSMFLIHQQLLPFLRSSSDLADEGFWHHTEPVASQCRNVFLNMFMGGDAAFCRSLQYVCVCSTLPLNVCKNTPVCIAEWFTFQMSCMKLKPRAAFRISFIDETCADFDLRVNIFQIYFKNLWEISSIPTTSVCQSKYILFFVLQRGKEVELL